ncbi:MAG: DHH family phosphoesterase, partial [Desulfovibrio sp.]|nr:DHH family phosphoesterase [Desulfovibrio sp.]
MNISTTFLNWLQAQSKNKSFCLLLVADPDALASALALRTLLKPRVPKVDLYSVNAVTRPDNLAMIRYLRIPVQPWDPSFATQYTDFALLDSQPSHHPAFASYTYSLIIDHHPEQDLAPFLREDAFVTIRKGLGATSSFMAKLIKASHKRLGPLLATALLYGIRTDTGAFERSGGDDDFSAYQWLSRYANINLLRRISRSEYLRAWLPLFARAFRSIRDCKRNGAHASLNEVESADLLVSIADFFTKV